MRKSPNRNSIRNKVERFDRTNQAKRDHKNTFVNQNPKIFWKHVCSFDVEESVDFISMPVWIVNETRNALHAIRYFLRKSCIKM